MARGLRHWRKTLTWVTPNFPEAACRDRPELPWFEEHGPGVREAKALCSGCPHVAACGAYALAHPELPGIWGGLSEADRTDLRFYHRGVTS